MNPRSHLPSVLRRRNGRSAGFVCLALLTLLSCQTSQNAVKKAPATQAPPRASAELVEQWVFHPMSRGTALDSVEVGGGVLQVDSQGSRWLRVGDQAPEVSPYGAPEALVGVALEDNKILAIGESGTVYIADDPLGRFVSQRVPPERWVRTAKTGRLLTSVSRAGQICRSSDLGRSWSQESSPEFFVDLQVESQGGLVALSVPEQWHYAKAPDQALRVLSVAPMAPQGLARDERGQLRVLGAFADYTFDPHAEGFVQLSEQKKKRRAPASALPPFAQATPVLRGQATLRGAHFAHLLSPKLPGRPDWRIESGGLDDVLRSHKVSGIEDCEDFLFTANQSHAALVCQSPNAGAEEMSPSVKILRSQDKGRTFAAVEGRFRGRISELAIDVSSKGLLAVGGLCLEEESEAGCRPRGVTLLGLKGRRHLHLVGVRRPEALGFGPENDLWILGNREKDRHTFLFGPLGAQASVPIAALDLTREAGLIERTTKAGSDAAVRNSGANSRSSALRLFLGSNSVSVPMVMSDGTVIATVDQSGALLTTSFIPGTDVVVSGAGSSLMALSTKEDRLWVSESGGAAWSIAALPRPICGGDPSCDPALVCSTSGCLLGDELSRLGFAGPPVDDFKAGDQDTELGSKGDPVDGYQCRLDRDPWTELPGLVTVPGASDAVLGEAAWAGVMLKSEQANAVAVAASLGQGQITERPLLPSVTLPDSYHVSLRPQIEGSAVVRFPRPSPARSGATRVEVGWDNRILGLLGGGDVTVTLSGQPSVSWPLDPSRATVPAFVSIAGRGVYLRMESRGAGSQTYFISGTHAQHTVEPVSQVHWPASGEGGAGWFERSDGGGRSREERMRLDGRHAPLLLVAGGHALFRPIDAGATALSGSPASQISPYLLGSLLPSVEGVAHRVGIAYRGGEPGFVSMHFVNESTLSRAEWVRPRPSGGYEIPLGVPLQSDLGASPSPCTQEQRHSSPRIVAPFHETSRRKIEVLGLPFALELTSDEAVLFGDPQSPCVAAWASDTVRPEAPNSSEQYDVLVIPGESQKSWLFRRSQHGESVTLAFARPLTCEAQPE